ncbi:MAG: hypothetical protein IPK64_12865 [bacterium]|nr:hypothetical protein [bacterium]
MTKGKEMRRQLKQRILVLQAVAGVAVAGVAAADMVGKPARAVGLLGLAGGMFAAGLSLGQALAGRKTTRSQGADHSAGEGAT